MNDPQIMGILLLFVLIFGVPYIIYLFCAPILQKKKKNGGDKKDSLDNTK